MKQKKGKKMRNVGGGGGGVPFQPADIPRVAGVLVPADPHAQLARGPVAADGIGRGRAGAKPDDGGFTLRRASLVPGRGGKSGADAGEDDGPDDLDPRLLRRVPRSSISSPNPTEPANKRPRSSSMTLGGEVAYETYEEVGSPNKI